MGYAVKLQKGGTKQISNGDQVSVALTGSTTGTVTFSVVYVTETEIALLSNGNLFTNDTWGQATSRSWGWTVTLNGKTYSSSDAGQSNGRCPTTFDIHQKCCTIFYGIQFGTYPSGTYWFNNNNGQTNAGYYCHWANYYLMHPSYAGANQNFGGNVKCYILVKL